MAPGTLEKPRVQGAAACFVEKLRLPIRALFRQVARAVRWVMAPTEAEAAAATERLKQWADDYFRKQRFL